MRGRVIREGRGGMVSGGRDLLFLFTNLPLVPIISITTLA